MSKPVQDQVQERVAELVQRLADLRSRLPAHSTPPDMAMEQEVLEEAIADLQKELQRPVPES